MKAIAIDGPAGAGKSTIAKKVAADIGYIYVDTGALYRAIGLYAFNNSIDSKDIEGIVNSLDNIKVELGFVDKTQRVFLNGEDVSDKIRMPEISMYASNVSAIPKVREFLFDLQRKIAEQNNIIMDGRDIGTVVLPNADVKIFLTATPQVRAKRRFDEHVMRGENVDFDTLLQEIIQRDHNDSTRAIAPLKQADDAILADTSEITLDGSIQLIKDIIKSKIAI